MKKIGKKIEKKIRFFFQFFFPIFFPIFLYMDVAFFGFFSRFFYVVKIEKNAPKIIVISFECFGQIFNF